MHPPKFWVCKALSHDLKFLTELEPEAKQALNVNRTLSATYKLVIYTEKLSLLYFHSENSVELVKRNKPAIIDRPRG